MRKWAGVSKDAFEQTVINPYRSLIYAMEDFDLNQFAFDTNPYMDEASFKAYFNQPLESITPRKRLLAYHLKSPNKSF
ncbi:MAG: hypothetical protein U0X58_00760 [Flavobacteriaceae bacterium]